MLNARELLRISNNKGRTCGQNAAANSGRGFNLIKKGLRLCLGLRKRSNDMERKAQAPTFGAIEGKQTVAEKLQAAGISRVTFYARLRRGWSEEAALSGAIGEKVGAPARLVMPDGRAAVSVAEQNGVERRTFYRNVKRGKSVQEAVK